MSLADRFGMSLSFYPMTQEEYLSIVDMLFEDESIEDPAHLHVLAARFAG